VGLFDCRGTKKRGCTFEEYVNYVLLNKNKEKFTIKQRNQSKSDTSKEGDIEMFHWKGPKGVDDPVAAVLDPNVEPFVLYYPTGPNFDPIDDAYKDVQGKFHLIQVTVQKDHSVNMDHINDFQNRFDTKVDIALNYFVPAFRYSQFKVKNPPGKKTIAGPSELEGMVCRSSKSERPGLFIALGIFIFVVKEAFHYRDEP
jgi:hypothetical protein